MLMFVILVITLCSRLFNRFSKANGFSILGSIIFLVSINMSLFYSFPRRGDEGVESSLFVLIGIFFADLFLIITILIFTIASIIKRARQNRNEEKTFDNAAILNN